MVDCEQRLKNYVNILVFLLLLLLHILLLLLLLHIQDITNLKAIVYCLLHVLFKKFRQLMLLGHITLEPVVNSTSAGDCCCCGAFGIFGFHGFPFRIPFFFAMAAISLMDG